MKLEVERLGNTKKEKKGRITLDGKRTINVETRENNRSRALHLIRSRQRRGEGVEGNRGRRSRDRRRGRRGRRGRRRRRRGRRGLFLL